MHKIEKGWYWKKGGFYFFQKNQGETDGSKVYVVLLQ